MISLRDEFLITKFTALALKALIVRFYLWERWKCEMHVFISCYGDENVNYTFSSVGDETLFFWYLPERLKLANWGLISHRDENRIQRFLSLTEMKTYFNGFHLPQRWNLTYQVYISIYRDKNLVFKVWSLTEMKT